MQLSRPPTPVEEKPKKVRFNIDDRLGGEPTLPPEVTHFLAEEETIKQANAPASTTMGHMDRPQPTHGEDP